MNYTASTRSRQIAWFIAGPLALLSPSNAFAKEYPYLYRSAYFLGRGDTGIALADDEDAIFYNPAGLATGKGVYKEIKFASPMLEFSQSVRDVAKSIAIQKADPIDTLRGQEGKAQHVGLNEFTGIVLRRAALGAFVHSSTTAMLFKDYQIGSLEAFSLESVTDGGVTFSLANNFSSQRFFFGLTAKYFKREQAGFSANAADATNIGQVKSDQISMLGTGTGVDLGFMFRGTGLTPLSIGITLQDVGNTQILPDKPTSLSYSQRPLKNIAQTFNAGFAIEPGTKMSRFKILVDYRDILGATKTSAVQKFHAGVELNVRGFMGFTSGINQGYGTFGTYVDLHFFRLDLGMYGEEIGNGVGSRKDIRYFARFGMGL